jgi:putative membrane protein
MLWVKAFHIVCMVSWMTGIFYLPRLFVYHAMCEAEDKKGYERFLIMERKLFYGIMTPSALLTIILGVWLIAAFGGLEYLRTQYWLHAKLFCVLLLCMHHVLCFVFYQQFRRRENAHQHRFYRIFNEVPVLLLIAICIFVVVKPF